MVSESPPEGDLISITEALEIAQISKPKLYRMFAQGVLHKMKSPIHPRRTWVSADELRRALEVRPEPPHATDK